MKASDVMVLNVITVGPDASVQEVADLLLRHRISAVPVVGANGEMLGIVSEGDLINRPEAETTHRKSWWLDALASNEILAAEYVKSHSRKVADVMTRDVITASPDTSVAEVAALLERKRIKRVPIVKNGKIVGIVSRANLLQALASLKDETLQTRPDDSAIRDKVMASLQNERWTRPALISVTVQDGTVDLWGIVEFADRKEGRTRPRRGDARRARRQRQPADSARILRKVDVTEGGKPVRSGIDAAHKAIGGRMMKAKDVMTSPVVSVEQDSTVLQAVRIMLQRRVSGLPVVDKEGKLIGMVTEGDFLRRAETDTQRRRPRWLEFLVGPGRLAAEYARSHGRKVSEVMTPDPITVGEETPLEDIVALDGEAADQARAGGRRGARSSASSAAPICCTRSRASPAKRSRPSRAMKPFARCCSPSSAGSRGRRWR